MQEKIITRVGGRSDNSVARVMQLEAELAQLRPPHTFTRSGRITVPDVDFYRVHQLTVNSVVPYCVLTFVVLVKV